MKPTHSPGTRGRPVTITRERIATAGIQIGLPNITFTGLAAALGVSHMALYKHVPSLEKLRHLIAQEMFQRWQIPRVNPDAQLALEDYLGLFTESVIEFVKIHPGVTPYAIRRLTATPAMLNKIVDHQVHIAQAYQLSMEQSRWLLATLAFHGMAVADTIYTVAGRAPLKNVDRTLEETEMEIEMRQGMRALIAGVLATLPNGEASHEITDGASGRASDA